MPNQPKTRSRRGVSIPPEPLAELLDQVNLLPRTDDELEAFSRFLIRLLLKTQEHLTKAPKSVGKIADWYERQIDRSPAPALCKSLHESAQPVEMSAWGITFNVAQNVIEIFDAWVRDREILKSVIESYSTQQAMRRFLAGEAPSVTADDTPLRSIIFGGGPNKPKYSITFSFEADSALRSDGFRVLDILRNHRVEVRRLGICPVCSKFYYAKKLIHQTCGTPACAQKFCRPSKRKQGSEYA